MQDREGAQEVFRRTKNRFSPLKRIWADGGYAGKLVEWVFEFGDGVLEIVKRTRAHRFVVLPKRWIVERTLAWLGRYRRMRKDYEELWKTVRR